MQFPVMAAEKRRPRHEARQARNDVYRQHIFAAAEQVFAERGFEATKVQDISKRAGLSMGTIYAIFASKEELFRAILDERGRELLRLAREIAAHHAPPHAALRALSDAYIAYFLAHPDFLRMHLREGTSWALSPAPDSDSRVRLWHDIHAVQAGIFRRGIAAGVFIDEDPGYLAKTYSAMDQALFSEWVAGGMKADRSQLTRRLHNLAERAFLRTSPTNGRRPSTRARKKHG